MKTSAEPPRVSIIIPTFNNDRLIGRTLDSVAAQTFKSFEVLVIDDGSTDQTARIVSRTIADDPRFRYVRLESNSNRPAVPRNRGLAEAQGEYVAFLDHDDIWTRRKLERQTMVLDARPDLALVHSYLWVFTERSLIRGLVFLPAPARQRANRDVLRRRNVIQNSSVLARTDVIRGLGGFDERPQLRAVEDYHLWYRIAKHHNIAYISEVHGYYRANASGTSAGENMIERHRYLDLHEGTMLIANQTSWQRIVARNLGRYPLAVYVHLLEGSWRQRFNRSPHIY